MNNIELPLSRPRRLGLLAAASFALALAHTPSALAQVNAVDVIKKAQAAMGGANVKTLQVRGVGPGGLFGQAYDPGFGWSKITFTNLTRVMDFEHEAYREDAARRRAELLGGGITPPFGHGDVWTIGFLKEGVAWNVMGPFVGPSPGAVPSRVNEFWTTSPHGAILAAKKFGAVAETRQRDGQSFSTLSFSIPRTMTAVVWVNAAGFVTRIDSKVPHALLGDTEVVTEFDEYRDVGGLKYPIRLRTLVAGTDVIDVTLEDIQVDVPSPIEVPEAIRTAKLTIGVEKIGEGLWLLRGPTHNSVAIEMKDQIVLVEAPLSEGYTRQIFLAANALVQGKKVGTVIVTHHHFDHTGGLPFAASEGATLVASARAVPFYEKVLANPRSIAPDRLATSGKKPVLVAVDDLKVLSDGNQRIEIHEIRDSSHSRGFLMVYLPKHRALVQADLFQERPHTTPEFPFPNPSEVGLMDNMDRLKLKVDTILPLHAHALTERELRGRTRGSMHK